MKKADLFLLWNVLFGWCLQIFLFPDFLIVTNYEITYTNTSAVWPICCMPCVYYASEWWGETIFDVSEEQLSAQMSLMYLTIPALSLYWLPRQDKCWISEYHIFIILPAPTITSLERHFSFPNLTVRLVDEKFLVIP